VDEPADVLRATRSSWDAATRDGGGACGLDVVRGAYTDMQAAWLAELAVHLAVREHADGG
jgi:hypothetical protein